jgi:predicted amidohydrolase YtcJ
MPAPEPRVWWNGSILGASRSEALYAEGGRVVAVGEDHEVLRVVPTGAERVDLGGRCVIPGLIDAHLHVGDSVRARDSVDLSGARSLPELLDLLRERLAYRPGPVRGGGWDQERLAERRMPTRSDLDRLRTDHPIVLYRICGHVATVNSAALDAAALTDRTPDPPDGAFGRSGRSLDGRLFDGAMDVLPALEDRWFPLSAEAVRAWLSDEASMGVVRLGAMSAIPNELRAVRTALGAGAPPVRVRAYVRAPWFGDLPGLRRELDGPALRVRGVKVMADGSLGARTAWLSEPYSDAPEGPGAGRVLQEDLEALLGAAAAAGASTAVHAIGDRTLSSVLDALDAVPEHGPVRIEHASVAPPPLIERAARHGVPLVVQPSFVPSDRWIEERLGPVRARWAYPYRTMLETGLQLAGSSDSPIESADPWSGLAAAVAPRARVEWAEAVTPEEALGMYTRGGAEALGDPGDGGLSPGSSADLVVLGSRRWVDALSLGRRSVLATYMAGQRTFASTGGGTAQGL